MTKSWVIFGLCPPPQRFFVCARIVCLCKVISVGEKIQWWILQLFCNATVEWREMTGNLWPIVCTQRLLQLSLIRSMNHPLIHFELKYTRPTFWNQFEELSNNYILLNFSIACKENVQWDIMSLKVSMFPRKRFSWKNNDHGLNGSTINLNKNSTWMIWCTWPGIISVFRLHHINPFWGPFLRNRIYAYFKWDTFELEKAMQTQQKWRSLRKSTSALRPRKRRWFSFLIKQTSETNLKWFWFALFEEETKNHYFNSNEVYN